jgi:DNA/RNA-binding domain of Phe-tRNA-synthetase-like protein
MGQRIELVLDGEACERFPDVQVAAFLAAGLTHGSLADVAAALIAEARESLRKRFETPAALVADARIGAWRDAMRMCGLSASDVRSSAEQLGRRLLAGGGVTAEEPLVRVYCAVSAKHLAPIGAYDVDRLPSRSVALRPARPDDVFAPLGTIRDGALTSDVIVYAADGEVLCYAFNHRDSARSALRADTERALFVAESAFAAQRPAMVTAIEELRGLLAGDGVPVGELALVSTVRPRMRVPAPTCEGAP